MPSGSAGKPVCKEGGDSRPPTDKSTGASAATTRKGK